MTAAERLAAIAERLRASHPGDVITVTHGKTVVRLEPSTPARAAVQSDGDRLLRAVRGGR